MMTFTPLDVLKFLVLIAGIVDAYKYRRQTNKIVRKKSSRNISRLFILLAIFCNAIIITYCVTIRDAVLTAIRLISMYTMCQLYWHVYNCYPYKTRGLDNFKRPSFFRFLKNSLTPNSISKRL